MADLFGFEELKTFATRSGQKVVRDDYTGKFSVMIDHYSKPLYRANKATRGWNPRTQLWNYAIKYDDSIVCRVFGDNHVGNYMEDYTPTWVQYSRTAIRSAVYEAIGDNTTPCIPGTIDGMFWLGHNYVRFYDHYVNIPMAMLDGRLSYDVTGDDSHGWFAGIKRKLIASLWEDMDYRKELNTYALNDLCEYAGYLYSLAYHVCNLANMESANASLSELDTAKMFGAYWQVVMGRKIYRPVAVKYYQEV